MIVRAKPRYLRVCGCEHPSHQRGPYRHVRICVRCLRPIQRDHKYRRLPFGGIEHKCCAYPACYETPEEYRQKHGEAMYQQMRACLFREGGSHDPRA